MSVQNEQDEMLEILKRILAGPKRAKNESGEVETHDLDSVIKALEYIKEQKSVDPLDAIRFIRTEGRELFK